MWGFLIHIVGGTHHRKWEKFDSQISISNLEQIAPID